MSVASACACACACALCWVQSLSSFFYFSPGFGCPAEGVRVMSGFRVWSLGFSLESRFRFCGFVWGLGFAV
jgi:hypothetical protein